MSKSVYFWLVALLLSASFARISGAGEGEQETVGPATQDEQIEQAVRDVQAAEQAVKQAMREVEYTDPECSKLKAELVDLEKRVISLRQQLYAAVRASEAVRRAEARRRDAVARLQKLREAQARGVPGEN